MKPDYNEMKHFTFTGDLTHTYYVYIGMGGLGGLILVAVFVGLGINCCNRPQKQGLLSQISCFVFFLRGTASIYISVNVIRKRSRKLNI